MKKLSILALAVSFLVSPLAFADNLRAEQLSPHIYALHGNGGTISVIEGDKEVYLIDAQYASATAEITQKVNELIPNKKIGVLISTHWHADHTGGNANFANAGAVIVAHQNTRLAMQRPQVNVRGETIPAYPEIALPKITFDKTLTMYSGNNTLQLEYMPKAHSGSDVIIYIPEENVLHLADILFNYRYPYIDLSANGSIGGMIKAVERALKIANDDTKIVAGHGKIATKADLKNYHKMLTSVRDKVAKAKKAGKTLAQVQAQKPTREWDNAYKNELISPDRFVELVYNSL